MFTSSRPLRFEEGLVIRRANDRAVLTAVNAAGGVLPVLVSQIDPQQKPIRIIEGFSGVEQQCVAEEQQLA